MNKEDLEKLGLTAETLKTAKLPEDLVKQIIVLHGKGIEAHKATIKGHEATIETSEETVKGLNTQLKDANTTIAGFKKLDPEGIKKAAADWEATAEKYQEDAKQAAKEADQKYSDLKYDTALNEALKDAKVMNTKAVKALLNTETIILKDGKFVGLDEQIEALRKSDENQFAPDKNTARIVDKTSSTTVLKSDDADLATALKFAGVSEVKEK